MGRGFYADGRGWGRVDDGRRTDVAGRGFHADGRGWGSRMGTRIFADFTGMGADFTRMGADGPG
jgi:hypothetical protein